jgi:hypothetical protein
MSFLSLAGPSCTESTFYKLGMVFDWVQLVMRSPDPISFNISSDAPQNPLYFFLPLLKTKKVLFNHARTTPNRLMQFLFGHHMTYVEGIVTVECEGLILGLPDWPSHSKFVGKWNTR